MTEQKLRLANQRGLSSWSVSLGIHLLLIVILGLMTFSDPYKNEIVLNAANDVGDSSIALFELTNEEPNLDQVDADVAEAVVSVSSPSSLPMPNVLSVELSSFQAVAGDTQAASPVSVEFSQTIQAIQLSGSSSIRSITQALDGRGDGERGKLLKKYGGSEESEAAVHLALKWLADHQFDDGGWSFAHNHVCNGQCDSIGNFAVARNGATAIALLPFLGAGQTHRDGKYKTNIDQGLRYLIKNMNRETPGSNASIFHGSWFEQRGTMYSHCLATIALSEAYAMTKDSALREPAQAGVDFLVASQNRNDGGWRYAPGDPGDTSVVGWAVMALKSAAVGGLEVPPETLKRTESFLTGVSSRQGSQYGYMAPNKNPHGMAATSAIGLLCRMYSGWPKSRRSLKLGVDTLSQLGPNGDHAYYTYYATQVLHHYGGAEWELWNKQMQDPIIQRQLKVGHAAGSWSPNHEMDGMAGGRLYTTAMMAMILEVYYRHMPLYQDAVLDDDFAL